MKYACLVYHEEQKMEAMTQSELASVVTECVAWIESLEQTGHHVFSAGLQSTRTAATVRVRNGKQLMTDGPHVETKEFLGGFTIIEAKDLNEAIHLVSTFPAGRIGSVEVRPLLDPHIELSEPLDRKIAAAIRSAVHPSYAAADTSVPALNCPDNSHAGHAAA